MTPNDVLFIFRNTRKGSKLRTYSVDLLNFTILEPYEKHAQYELVRPINQLAWNVIFDVLCKNYELKHIWFDNYSSKLQRLIHDGLTDPRIREDDNAE